MLSLVHVTSKLLVQTSDVPINKGIGMLPPVQLVQLLSMQAFDLVWNIRKIIRLLV